jgi:predicted N-acyltransferase
VLDFKLFNSYITLPTELDNFIGNNLLWNLDFLKTLEQSGSIGLNTGWDPNPLVIYENKSIVGFVPMFIKYHSYGEYVFDWSWAEAHQNVGIAYFPKLFIGIPFTPLNSKKIIVKTEGIISDVIEFIEKYIDRKKLSSAHYVFSDSEDSVNNFFEKRFWSNRKTIQYIWDNNDYANFDSFLITLKREKRKKINQDRKKVINSGLSFATYEDLDITNVLIDFFYRCYEITYHQHGSSPYISKAFFDEYINNNKDRVVLFCAKKNQNLVGAAFCIKINDSLYGRYWGSVEYYPSLHFELSYYQGIEYCIKNKLNKFYAGIQGEHKLSRGFNPFFSNSYHFLKDERFKNAIADFSDREGELNKNYLNELTDRNSFKDF